MLYYYFILPLLSITFLLYLIYSLSYRFINNRKNGKLTKYQTYKSRSIVLVSISIIAINCNHTYLL
ncbi:hypothetical protein C2G38_2058102 [Gigaspora rosea]|uniref:Uncharacterized protein n=1 Tax=Gigaspora rosea TaxID=44941 RepID=A0A397V4K2_9GLOM|nr:hypothetical protein C2G38_2089760 [Gigaspora rosea]RIB28907.1 hypothetical protein C2G38_2058102 [Gigaspora rosea]